MFTRPLRSSALLKLFVLDGQPRSLFAHLISHVLRYNSYGKDV